jgi:hypothetical protein
MTHGGIMVKPAEKKSLPVLVTSNIRDGELRRLSTWTAHKGP